MKLTKEEAIRALKSMQTDLIRMRCSLEAISDEVHVLVDDAHLVTSELIDAQYSAQSIGKDLDSAIKQLSNDS